MGPPPLRFLASYGDRGCASLNIYMGSYSFMFSGLRCFPVFRWIPIPLMRKEVLDYANPPKAALPNIKSGVAGGTAYKGGAVGNLRNWGELRKLGSWGVEEVEGVEVLGWPGVL